ncbi:4-alpha-glucanotransferase [Trichlorobacter lovleyi]|uniref:4-alpha-glucanotransferase n=1 Tax=Trichlorobacter lovleyi TaxID=313985 RepID=UPI0023F145CC|nr:4-alpha-glucanotransferase [Trichlorobacter lovleyi]
MTVRRRAGVLLHPTSLPGPEGIGTFGTELTGFLDFLSKAGFSLWQVLPLTPPAAGNSPYSSYSAFGGNHLLIDLQQLVEEGDLSSRALQNHFPQELVDFKQVTPWKEQLLHEAAENFFKQGQTPRLKEFWQFCDTTYWLHDYALFMALKQHYHGPPWHRWPNELAQRNPRALQQASLQLGPEIGARKYQQWQFFRQWQRVRSAAAERGIAIIGDLPIFVAHDSADVWCNQELFLLDTKGKSTVVAGVPPDYFSATGQLWGNPLYNWVAMEQQGYGWWIARFRQLFELFDQIRIDHFRGFEAAWHVPATAKTAARGSWVPGPGVVFFDAVKASLGNLSFIAEDLGVITPEVEALRDRYDLPGMKILQFAFDSDAANPYLPHNHRTNSVVYTGTHDNDTTRGWFNTLSPKIINRMYDYLGLPGTNPVQDLIRVALMSVAGTAIIPLQDLLELPTEARMNRPGVALGNWSWRYQSTQLKPGLADYYADLLRRYGRG